MKYPHTHAHTFIHAYTEEKPNLDMNSIHLTTNNLIPFFSSFFGFMPFVIPWRGVVAAAAAISSKHKNLFEFKLIVFLYFT